MSANTMSLNDWFQKGMSIEEYIERMTVNKEEQQSIYDNFQLPDEDRAFFEKLSANNWRVIVLTADWCGDAMLCVPIFMHIAEAASIEMSLLNRDDNLELMDQYLTNGKSRSIPIFIFIDREGNEKAVWGPRAPEVQELIEELRDELPPQDDPSFDGKQQQMYREFKRRLLSDASLWIAVSRSMRERLSASA